MGDPCGIGPEVIAKSLTGMAPNLPFKPIIVGSSTIMNRAFDLIGSPLKACPIMSPEELVPAGFVALIETLASSSVSDVPAGRINPIAGKASAEWIHAAGILAIEEKVDGICTAPVNKASMQLGGSPDLDHQSIFKRMCKSDRVMTMLMTSGLRVAHLTTHHSFRTACEHVTYANVLESLRLIDTFFKTYGFSSPRIGVAALNPHGGEEGLLGNEEVIEITPAVEAAKLEGINAQGPIPADSVFTQAVANNHDVVLAMYHDQGHIAIKVLNWEKSVTMNLGLPFLRTSVDHGTAFNIAGKGIADSTSMENALKLAAVVATEGYLPDVY